MSQGVDSVLSGVPFGVSGVVGDGVAACASLFGGFLLGGAVEFGLERVVLAGGGDVGGAVLCAGALA